MVFRTHSCPVVKTAARIVEGDPGKVICQEADRLKPVTVVFGTGGSGLLSKVLYSVNIILPRTHH
uniref:Uncharacterized protein n=1 Tax=Populus trichocarpa TaxID=3694 RepID=A0A2K1Z6I2_POPTR